MYKEKTCFHYDVKVSLAHVVSHIFFSEFIPPSYLDPEDDGAKPEKTLKCEWMYPFSTAARGQLLSYFSWVGIGGRRIDVQCYRTVELDLSYFKRGYWQGDHNKDELIKQLENKIII